MAMPPREFSTPAPNFSPTRDEPPTLNLLVGWLVGALLLGDYLVLSATYVITGYPSGWMPATIGLQTAALAVLAIFGRLWHTRIELLIAVVPLMICVILHLIFDHVHARPWNDLQWQKLSHIALVTVPALILGLAVGHQIQRRHLVLWLVAFLPWWLIVGLGIAVTNPTSLHLTNRVHPNVWADIFILPAHQELAYVALKHAVAITTLLVTWPQIRRWAPLFGVPILFIVALLAILSGGRSGTFGLIAGCMVAFGLKIRSAWPMAVMSAAAMLITAGILTFAIDIGSVQTLERYQRNWQEDERVLAWDASIKAIGQNPLIGSGPASLGKIGGWGENENVYAHNMPLELFGEFGLLGFLTWLAIVGAIALRLILRLSQRTPLTASAVFAVAFFSAALVMTQGTGDLPRNSFFFLAAGMAFSALAPPQPASQTGTKTPPTIAGT